MPETLQNLPLADWAISFQDLWRPGPNSGIISERYESTLSGAALIALRPRRTASALASSIDAQAAAPTWAAGFFGSAAAALFACWRASL